MQELMDNDIEILDVEESQNVRDVLNKESKTREDMLRFTNEEMMDHTLKMVEFIQTKEDYTHLQEKYNKLEQENKINLFKMSEYEVDLKMKEEEIISLKTECAKTRKKMVTVQSLLQVLVNYYGMNEIMNIIGIPYTKLKEYLQD